MAQRAQVVDITKSYLPGDPNAYVQSLVNTDREDGEEKTMPLLAYEGYNFLPTSQGYKSYFGTSSILGITALTSRVQFVLLYQTPTYKNRLVALCEDGIWVCTADGSYADWVHVVVHSYNSAVFEEWTWCVIENVLYMYKQGTAQVYRTTIGTWTIPAVAGTLVGDPTTYQTFTDTVGVTGSGTDFWNGNFHEIYVQYSDGADFSAQGTINAGFTITGATPSIDIALTGTTPVTTPNPITTARIYIYDDDIGDTYYKDFLLSTFPISIPDLTGFSPFTGYQPQTLTLEGVAEVILSSDLTITSFVPTFLNMTGQMGIFRAGLRLGMWDSANSVSWSSNLDLTNFTPSIETLAGNTIFGRVIGRIVTCKGHGEGFVVYSTKSVVGVTFTAAGNLLWDAKAILDNTGISYSKAVTCGKTDSEHFLFGTTGIYTVGKYNALAGRYDAEPILPEIYDLLKESRDPIHLTVLQDRYLCFSVIENDYIFGRISFYRGVVDPLNVIIDWYTTSTTYPTATTLLGNSQMWEIIRTELSGQRGVNATARKKSGEWVPKFTTTVDIMDDRHYSWWRNYIGEASTRLSYETNSALLNILPMVLTSGNLASGVDAQRPTAPPDAYRYGVLRSSAGIRSMWGLAGGDRDENNETLIWAQECEWAAFIRHQLENKSVIEAYELVESNVTDAHTTYTAGNGYTIVSTDPVLGASYATEVTKIIGTVITGSGNNEWLVTEGPTEKAAKEVILRRAFNKAFRVTKRIVIAYAGDPATYTTTINDSQFSILYRQVGLEDYYYMDPSPFNGLTYTSEVSAADARTQVLSLLNALNLAPSSSDMTVLETLYQGEGQFRYLKNVVFASGSPYTWNQTQMWLASYGGSVWSHAFQNNYFAPNAYMTGDPYSLSIDESSTPSTVTATVTTTYLVEEITGTYGYSQFRALVTHWDRIKFGLYGDYEILETVPAEAMTAKIWEGTYPTDLGADRNELWSYSEYKAQKIVDLREGTIGTFDYASGDPLATVYSDIVAYNNGGLTSYQSTYTLPGASFLIQTGSISPAYSTFVGALVYDFQLKKWGKYKGEHKVLIETTPVNTAQNNSITYDDLGTNAGIFDVSGYMRLFDAAPSDSWIRYGKIGSYRLGMTDLVEVRAQMRYATDFKIQSESSRDGKVIDSSISTSTSYYDEVVAECYIDVSARWHTVKISGNYDLTGLEVRSKLAGRR
jgi:hypothetical protein